MNPLLHPSSLPRRTFLKQSGISLGAAALATLLAGPARAGSNPKTLAPLPGHFPAPAKHVIYLHMVGAPSQLDLFDPKPALVESDGELCPQDFIKGKRFAFLRGHPKLLGSRFSFSQHGASGQWMSELLPHLSTVADELAVIRSLHTDEFNHGPAQSFQHTGFSRLGHPSLGSWLTYGLGSENQNLPAYVVLVTGADPGAGSTLWSSGFLPSVHQGIQFRSTGDPVLFLSNPPGHPPADRQHVIDAIKDLNQTRHSILRDPEIQTRISQYELAFRMQTSVPELMDISQESPAVLAAYKAKPGQTSFANNCLLARRLVERGVRVVQLYDQGWDHHSNLFDALPKKCRQIDQPIAALINDLRQRGLLDETLIVWAGEFGRTPMLQGDAKPAKAGRDHHREAFTVWLAGGGVQPGISYGQTDELGYHITEQPAHIHDLNATILHLLGLDHQTLTYKYQGRHFRLTDVHGHVLHPLLS